MWRGFKSRRITLSFVVFFVAWQVVQLYVVSMHGAETAIWWFYFDGPLSPGYLFAPISHNMADLGHLRRNVVILLVVGGVAEPYLEEFEYLALVLGISFASIAVADLLSILAGTQWVLAGASGGIFGLWAYFGVKNRSLLFSSSELWGFVEEVITFSGVLTLLFVPVYDVYTSGVLNVSHLVGILLGYVIAFVESPPYSGPNVE